MAQWRAATQLPACTYAATRESVHGARPFSLAWLTSGLEGMLVAVSLSENRRRLLLMRCLGE